MVGCVGFNVPVMGFYGSGPTNNVKVLKEDGVVRIRLKSHPVHPTMLQ